MSGGKSGIDLWMEHFSLDDRIFAAGKEIKGLALAVFHGHQDKRLGERAEDKDRKRMANATTGLVVKRQTLSPQTKSERSEVASGTGELNSSRARGDFSSPPRPRYLVQTSTYHTG